MPASEERQRENVEFGLRSFEVWLSGNREEALSMMADDIEIHVPAELVNAGTYRGHEAFLRWIDEWEEAWTDYEMEIESSEPAGERHVVSSVRQRAKGAGSGVEVEMAVAWLTEIRDGKLAALHLYSTPEEARRVASEREAA